MTIPGSLPCPHDTKQRWLRRGMLFATAMARTLEEVCSKDIPIRRLVQALCSAPAAVQEGYLHIYGAAENAHRQPRGDRFNPLLCPSTRLFVAYVVDAMGDDLPEHSSFFSACALPFSGYRLTDGVVAPLPKKRLVDGHDSHVVQLTAVDLPLPRELCEQMVGDSHLADFSAYAASIAASVRLIQVACGDDTVRELLAQVRWLCPLLPGPDQIHTSFSVQWLPSFVFASPCNDTVRLAEALMHEWAHCQLNLLDGAYPLLSRDDNAEQFYAPWRPDARPLRALLHGIAAFLNVATFYHGVCRASVSELSRRQASCAAKKVLIAACQAERSLLSPSATKVLDDAVSSCTRILLEIPLLNDDRSRLRDHYDHHLEVSLPKRHSLITKELIA